ncbi:MAG: hypothetical protein Q7S17_02680, partial [Xanthobacteraceae bacterium]|nr:hypothetical protein [Xanthobacteraceae bacterium]
MLLPRQGLTATRPVAFAAWLSFAAAIAAGFALAEDKLPAYPPPLTPELSPSPAQSPRPAAKNLAVSVTPLGAAAKERPLPVGAMPSLRIGVRNTGTGVLAKIVLTARFEGMQAENPPGWRSQGGALILEIPRLGAGEQTERLLKLRVVTPTSGKTTQVSIEARTEDGAIAAGEANLRVADCVGAYRSKLSSLRTGMLQAVKDAAEAMRKPDPALPYARQFPATGVKTGNIAVAERFAAAFAKRGGADPEMSSEDSRFTIQRWTSELSAYAGQEANPGLCAGNYYMVAGQREGILP